jgi:uncharacterized phiE125 gp8 family phage protein
MQLTLVTAPATDAVTLAEVRQWLNITPGLTEEDAALETLIDEIYDYIEKQTNRKILTQTWKVTLDANEISDTIRLPLVRSVSMSSDAIVTTDDAGDDTTVASTNYRLRAGENPRIVLTRNGSWPTDMRDHDSMAITVVCGYNGDVIPYPGWVPASTTSTSTLNDMTAGGTFTGTAKTLFEVEIDAVANPDTIQWRKTTRDANGVKTIGSWTTGVAITGSSQTLTDGTSVTFAATKGHALGDGWTVQLYERLPLEVKLALKGMILHFYQTKGRGVSETVSGQLVSTPRVLQHLIDSLRVVPW